MTRWQPSRNASLKIGFGLWQHRNLSLFAELIALGAGLGSAGSTPVTEAVVARAETLAGDHALRSYDAVQLASALAWQESVGAGTVVATF